MDSYSHHPDSNGSIGDLAILLCSGTCHRENCVSIVRCWNDNVIHRQGADT